MVMRSWSSGVSSRKAWGYEMFRRGSRRDPRFLLWIDGVGGYLVCLGEEMTLGQPIAGSTVDIPLLGDISREHARVRRAGEHYLLEPLRPTTIDHREVTGAVVLNDGQIFEMGAGVRVRFSRPHPLSTTARLDMASGHRTHPPTDGIVLLADACILGPGAQSHVRCPDWTRDVMLCRDGNQLECRSARPFEIDGQTVEKAGLVRFDSRISAGDFSMSLEALDRA